MSLEVDLDHRGLAPFPAALCPFGFTIPDEPSDPRNIYVNRTLSDCAVSCYDSPMFTPGEFDTLSEYRMWSLGTVVVISGAVVLIWLSDTMKRKQVFIVTYGVVLLVCSLIELLVETAGPRRFCLNRSVSRDGGDGLSLCSAEAAALTYSLLFFAWCFCLQSLVLWRRLVLGQRQAPDPRVHVGLLLGLPLLSVVPLLFTGSFHPPLGGITCTLVDQQDSMLPTLLFSAPLFACVAVGSLCSLSILVALVNLARETGGGDGGDGHRRERASKWGIAALVGTSLKFLLFSGLCVLAFACVDIFVAVPDTAERLESLLAWGACVLAHYDGLSSESYLDACGAHPPRRSSFQALASVVLGSGLSLGAAYLLVNMEGLYHWLKSGLRQRSASVLPSRKQGQYSDSDSNSDSDCSDEGTGGTSTTEAYMVDLNARVFTELSAIAENPYSGCDSGAYEHSLAADFSGEDSQMGRQLQLHGGGGAAYSWLEVTVQWVSALADWTGSRPTATPTLPR